MNEVPIADWGPAGTGDLSDWCARLDAERGQEAARQIVEFAAAVAALSVNDPDFSVLAFDFSFAIVGVPGPANSALSEGWRLVDEDDEDDGAADEANAKAIDAVQPEMRQALAFHFARFAKMGMIRADRTFYRDEDGYYGCDAAASFHLAVRTCDLADGLTALAEWPVSATPLHTVSGASLEISCATRPVNATRLHAALAIEDRPLGEWQGAATPDLLPQAGETREAWLARVSIQGTAIADLLARWETVGRDPCLFDLYGSAEERSLGDAQTDWLAEGRFPRGCVTLLVGNNQSGKSSFAHEIAAALGCVEATTKRPRTILGKEVLGQYVVALISGEDTQGVIEERGKRHATIWGTSRIFVIDGGSEPFAVMLDKLECLPFLDLVIIDPARAFLEGDEDSSKVVSEFYDRLTRLARLKNCSVLVVHHLTKGRPRSLSQMLPMVRGSGVHTDRARVVIGMIDRGSDVVEIGPIKYNFPADMMWARINEGTLYRRDPETFTLVALHDETGPCPQPADATGRVLKAVGRCELEQCVVRRSGKRGLFELRLPELALVSRSAVLDAITLLLSEGRLSDGAEGLKTVSPPAIDGEND